MLRPRKWIDNDETFDYYTNLLRDADTFLYGRKTYQMMVPYWPDIAKNHSADSKREADFAQAFDAIDKIVVFSRSLERAEHLKTVRRNQAQMQIEV